MTSTKVAAGTLCRAIRLAVLSALLLSAAVATQAQEILLNSFNGDPDGANPESRLTFHNGNLYGTTHGGGLGSGTVFELTPDGSGGWTENVIYNFCSLASCADGANPTYSYVIFDTSGNLYGTAYAGGANGYGAVFELSPSGDSWKEKVLYSFANTPDGANPVNGLIVDSSGNLYGTTWAGGKTGNGTVYEMTQSSGVWKDKVISNIKSTYSGLIMDAHGNIFGTTYNSVFEMSPNGKGGWQGTTIFSFTSGTNASKYGSDPNGTPAFDSAGNLYGTTYGGGTNGNGAVYKLSPGASGWTPQVLYEFGTEGAHPLAGVLLDSAGNVYGTTTQGGKLGDGNVFELVPPTGTGAYAHKILFPFDGPHGNDPYDSLIMDNNGYLYGTTYLGGSNGIGTVFEVDPKAVATTTHLTSSVNPSTQGEAVTFTATVSSSKGPPPDGEMIAFETGGYAIGSAPLADGVAKFTTSSLPNGKTVMQGVYFGNLNFKGSSSNFVGQVVNP
jgi:uncharacterized repeat protein (TIGR03803 family)